MKKRLAVLFAAACMLTTSAFALTRSQLNTADALNSLGLFKGTGEGYALNVQLKRSDGITLLVRLMGKESDALSGKHTHPFKDVAEWLDPYVGCAYDAGYTTGTGATTYGSTKSMTRPEFYTMMLRALGYTDQGENADFTLETAVEFAATLGMDDSDQKVTKFSRADAIEVFWKAMSTNLKGKGQTLAESLVARGVFTQAQLDEASKLQSNPYPNEEMVVNERTGNLITKRQATIDKVAYAFWDKHMNTDYDQRAMVQATALDKNGVPVSRRENRSAPELASEEHRVFLDCSGFIFATYNETFGAYFEDSVPWFNTSNMSSHAKTGTADDVIYYYAFAKENDMEERAAVLEEMKALIEPGDVVVYRRYANTGHTVMYLDGGATLESTGSDYKPGKGTDSFDKNGTVTLRNVRDYMFNLSSTRCCVRPGYVNAVCILRPLNVVGQPTERSQARLDLGGRLAISKLCIKQGQTVEPGQKLTFRIVLDNVPETGTSKDLVVNVTDPLPTNVTFVSASEGGQLKDGVITWNNVSVPNNTVKELTYTVTVSADSGIIKSGTAYVNGIDFTYRDLQIGRSMTASQFQTLKDKIAEGMPEGSTAIEYVNSIYKSALGKDLGVTTDNELIAALYDNVLDGASDQRYCAAPDLSTNAGKAAVTHNLLGRRVISMTLAEHLARPRYLKEESLQPGDLIFMQDNLLHNYYYIYVGEGQDMVKIGRYGMETEDTFTALEALLAHRFFALLRPSMI